MEKLFVYNVFNTFFFFFYSNNTKRPHTKTIKNEPHRKSKSIQLSTVITKMYVWGEGEWTKITTEFSL